MTDDIQLTPSQSAALEAVRAKPGMPTEFYVTDANLEINVQMTYDLGFLIFNGFISRDPQTDALTAKG